MLLWYRYRAAQVNDNTDDCNEGEITIFFSVDLEICRIQMANSFPYQSNFEKGSHRLAVIVPFRNRFEELQEFVPYMKNFLQNQSVSNDIYIVNQVTQRFYWIP